MYTRPIFLASLFLIQSLTYFRLIPVTHNPSTNASLTDSILRDGILFSSRDASPAFNCSPAGLFILIFRRGTGVTNSHVNTVLNTGTLLTAGRGMFDHIPNNFLFNTLCSLRDFIFNKKLMTNCVLINYDKLVSLDPQPDKFTRIRSETCINLSSFCLGSPDPDTDKKE